jgi:O-antigen/teichoic acid export membrane protein
VGPRPLIAQAATAVSPDVGAEAPSAVAAPLRGQPRKGLGRGATTSFILQTGGTALQYVTQFVLARLLGVNAFGTYTYTLTWARLGGTLSHLGGASSGVRFVPEYVTTGQWSLLRGVLRRFRLIAVTVGSAVAVVTTVAVLLSGGTTRTTVTMIVAIWTVPLAGLVELDQALLRGFKLIFRAFFPWLILQPIVLIAVLVGGHAAGVRMTAPVAMVLTLGSFLAAVGLAEWWLLRAVPAEARHAPVATSMRNWSKVTFPIFISNAVYIVFSKLDVVMVGMLISVRAAGIYAVASRAGGFASILQTAMNATVAPRISQLHWAGHSTELEDVVLTAIRWVIVPTFLLTAAMCLASGPALHIFGEGFRRGRWVVIIVAVGQLVSVSNGPVGWLMNMTGNQNVTAVVFGGTAALTLVGYVVLIPLLGINGAALANAGAVVVRNVVLNRLAHRRLGYRISVARALLAGRRS